jgi:antirestriction protein ArdC
VAEVGAAFLMNSAGLLHETLDNSAAYLRSWVKVLKGDSRLVVRAAASAQKAADLILGKTEAAVAETDTAA